jgi:hypothetical protein
MISALKNDLISCNQEIFGHEITKIFKKIGVKSFENLAQGL